MGRALVAGLLLCVVVSGCGVSYMAVPPLHAGGERPRDRLWVGVKQVDITPPIGLGMFGHGPESRISTGIALRLRCQVFVVSGPSQRTGGSEVLALVPCDLPAPSLYLQRKIATYVANNRHVPIGAARIALMATHAHYAPGHYFVSDGYTGPFSARRSGLDDDFVDLLAQEIGDGIADAYWDAKPARIAWGYKALHGLARNRSVAPFLHNDTLPAELQSALQASREQPDLAAVDPLLSVMRVDQWDPATSRYKPAGALAFYGVHPSVVNNRNSLYTGDLFGYATRHASELISQSAGVAERPCGGLVVGLANGIEGDVTSNRTSDTHREARRLGHRLGDEIAEVWASLGRADAPYDTAGPLDVAYRELHWTNALLRSGARLCAVPGQGTPAAGGGSDHPTSMRIFSASSPGARAPRPKGEPPCGWPRYPLIGIDPNAPPGGNYPDVAPLLLARIGHGVVAAAPAELTTVTGYRVREAIEAQLPKPTGKITLAGLTNEYLGYIATYEEYQWQHYEGASTLYGPNSERFLREQFGCLAQHMSQGAAGDACANTYDQQPQQPAIDTTVLAPYKTERNDVLTPGDEGALLPAPRNVSEVSSDVSYEGERVFSVRFDGPAPSELRAREDLDISVMLRSTTIANSAGESIRIVYDDAATHQPWKALWIAPLDPSAPVCGKKVHFVLGNRSGAAFSQSFTVDCSLPAASRAWP